MEFFKYQAAGNDFILLRSLDRRAELPEQEIIRLCDRRYGIGADGLIILESSPVHDFTMRFYNNDGSSGMMCGNGGRCIVDMARRSGIPASGEDGSWIFEAPDGVHRGKVLSTEGQYSRILLRMNDITAVEEIRLPQQEGQEPVAWKMNTGTDHLVIFKDNIEGLDVYDEGRKWRYAPESRCASAPTSGAWSTRPSPAARASSPPQPPHGSAATTAENTRSGQPRTPSRCRSAAGAEYSQTLKLPDP